MLSAPRLCAPLPPFPQPDLALCVDCYIQPYEYHELEPVISAEALEGGRLAVPLPAVACRWVPHRINMLAFGDHPAPAPPPHPNSTLVHAAVHHLGHHQTYTERLNLVMGKLRSDPNYNHLAKPGIDALLDRLHEVPPYQGGCFGESPASVHLARQQQLLFWLCVPLILSCGAPCAMYQVPAVHRDAVRNKYEALGLCLGYVFA